MKTIALLSTLLTLAALAMPAPAADKKEEKKERREKRDDKKKDDKAEEKKEEIRNEFEVIVEGAKDATEEEDVKTFLGSIEGVRIEKCEKTAKGLEAVLSTKTKITRADVGKVLKDNKNLKVSEFKAVRPSREKKDEKKDEKKST